MRYVDEGREIDVSRAGMLKFDAASLKERLFPPALSLLLRKRQNGVKGASACQKWIGRSELWVQALTQGRCDSNFSRHLRVIIPSATRYVPTLHVTYTLDRNGFPSSYVTQVAALTPRISHIRYLVWCSHHCGACISLTSASGVVAHL